MTEVSVGAKRSADGGPAEGTFEAKRIKAQDEPEAAHEQDAAQQQWQKAKEIQDDILEVRDLKAVRLRWAQLRVRLGTRLCTRVHPAGGGTFSARWQHHCVATHIICIAVAHQNMPHSPRCMQVDMQSHREVLRIHREAQVQKEPLLERRSQLLRNIDMFWAHTLCNSEVAQYISEHDRELLQHLDSVCSPLPVLFNIVDASRCCCSSANMSRMSVLTTLCIMAGAWC